MNFFEKIKAFKLIGKKVKAKRVELPDIIGHLFSVDRNGYCVIEGGGFDHISNIQATNN